MAALPRSPWIPLTFLIPFSQLLPLFLSFFLFLYSNQLHQHYLRAPETFRREVPWLPDHHCPQTEKVQVTQCLHTSLIALSLSPWLISRENKSKVRWSHGGYIGVAIYTPEPLCEIQLKHLLLDNSWNLIFVWVLPSLCPAILITFPASPRNKHFFKNHLWKWLLDSSCTEIRHHNIGSIKN